MQPIDILSKVERNVELFVRTLPRPRKNCEAKQQDAEKRTKSRKRNFKFVISFVFYFGEFIEPTIKMGSIN